MVVFITKTLCYHQVYVADDLYKIYGDSFKFIQMREPLDWRIKNKQEGFERPYLLTYVKNEREVKNLIKNAEVIVFGEAPLKLISLRKPDCLLFKMSENIFKDTYNKKTFIGEIKRCLSYKFLKLITNNNHSYLLSCGGFAPKDYKKLGLFKNRMLKWGYFPVIPILDKKTLFKKFDHLKNIELVWVSRLVKVKNPLYLIDLVEYLLSKNICNFHLTVVGDSSESDFNYFVKLSEMIRDKKLQNHIDLVGKVESDKVFEFYKKAHLALFTSDISEGWSVGIGEAMSCGCAIVSSNAIGASPFLVNKTNGLIFDYNSSLDFCYKVESLITNSKSLKMLADNGFSKIEKEWNHTVAAKNLSSIINLYSLYKQVKPFDDGPCSTAKILDYNWYKE